MDRLNEIIRICDDAPKPRDPGTLSDFQSRFDAFDEGLSRILYHADAERDARDALIAAVKRLLGEYDEERGTIDCRPDGWCDACTLGLTPANDPRRMTCPRHEVVAVLAHFAGRAP